MVTLHIEIEQHFAGLHSTCPQAYKDVLMKINGILPREDECTYLSGGGRLLDSQVNLRCKCHHTAPLGGFGAGASFFYFVCYLGVDLQQKIGRCILLLEASGCTLTSQFLYFGMLQ